MVRDVGKTISGPKEKVDQLMLISSTCFSVCITWSDHLVQNVKDTIFVRHFHIARIKK